MAIADPNASIPLLRLSGVGLSYPSPDGQPRLAVLDSISFAAADGDVVCVAGRSGSGKTSLLNIASGLLAPDRGRVSWEGNLIYRLSADERVDARRRLVGIVFQGGGLLDSLTALENVALPGVPAGVTETGERRAQELLDQVGIGARRHHYPQQLSGGEQQRVALARALFADPRLLIVDEPTANLDRGTADAVIHLLLSLADSRRAVLLASHDPHVIDASSLRIDLEASR